MHISFRRQINTATISILLRLFMLPLLSLATMQAYSLALPVPNPRLQPEDVVEIVLDALAKNDTPYANAGIETTFNFASPSNKAVTGPLDRFITMVKGPVYSVMVDHKSHVLSEVVITNNRAYQWVRLITASGATVHFGFRLGLQSEGKYKGMWLTEVVWPLDADVEGIRT